jgi:hypothetical protein
MTLAIAILALVVSIVAAFISIRELQETQKANAFPAAVDLFREFRDPKMVAARRRLLEELPELDPEIGIRGLPEDLQSAFLRISHYLDNLGVLVSYELMKPEMAAAFLGDSALQLWKTLEDFIAKERELRSFPEYQTNFEHLAATVEALQPSRARAGLKKMA